MIEQILFDYLNTVLDVPVYTEIPSGAAEKFVTIERTSGGETNHLKEAIFAVQSHAGSLFEAAELNETVKAAMFGASELGGIASVRLNSDYNYSDGAQRAYRYQAVYLIYYY